MLERRLTMTARQYLGYLSTVSAYLELPGTAQARVFGAIEHVLPAEVEIAADVIIHLARRSSSGAPD